MRAHAHSFFLRPFACLALVCAAACSESAPDPRTVRGAIAAAARAIEQEDPARLFRLIDQRARHALASIVKDRQEAKALIEAQYPVSERPEAIAALGDAAAAGSAEALFALRCPAACMRGLAQQLAAPKTEAPSGPDVLVTTVRGTTLYMHAGKDGLYGLVWNTPALSEERDHASRTLVQIRENAAVYQRRRALEGADPPPSR